MNQVVLDGVVFNYRPETNDLGIIDQVFTHNACHFPDNMTGQRVIDIGAHIGAASLAAAKRGARVTAYEPATESYRVLFQNMLSNSNLFVWTVKMGIGPKSIDRIYLHKFNTGMNSNQPDPNLESEVVHNVPVSFVIPGSICDFLKVDCEGCEDDIVADIARYHEFVKRIYIEFHTDKQDANLALLRQHWSVSQTGLGYLCE